MYVVKRLAANLAKVSGVLLRIRAASYTAACPSKIVRDTRSAVIARTKHQAGR
jgi:hypothetical protein